MPPERRPDISILAAYGAAVLAFTYALVSLYWALGNDRLISTIGGYVQSFERNGGAGPVVVAVVATLAKVAGGLLALALVRPWGRAIPRNWLLGIAVAATAALVLYGLAEVGAGIVVLNGAIHPSGVVDRNVLRWHAELWDLWFLLWGLLLAVATNGYRRRTAPRVPSVP